MKSKKAVSLCLIYTLYCGLFAPFAATAQTEASKNPEASGQTEKKGLQFRLREENNAPAEKRETRQPAKTENLSESETNAILRRLPQMEAEPVNADNFAQRANSLPAPKTGNTIQTKFPADEKERAVSPPVGNGSSTPGNLEIVRFAPEGDVSIAPDLSVTFSQPMIALMSQSQAGENVPVKLTPAPKGKWRWAGTKTLIFDADPRLPMATKYTATAPAGTRSANGAVLTKDFSWTFSTSPPKVVKLLPEVFPVKRDALIAICFDQEISPPEVLKKIGAEANGQKLNLRLAMENEIAADPDLTAKIKDWLPKRFLVFRAVELLPPESSVSIVVEAGAPSAEGPLTATASQRYAIKTNGQLKLIKSYCGYGEYRRECFARDTFQLKFNNPLDEKSFDKSLVKIEPAIEDPEISVSGNEIEIRGFKKSRTNYKVTVSGALKDNFGQMLGDDVSASFKTDPEEPELFGQNEHFVVLDPNAPPKYSVYSTNYKSLKVKIYKVGAEDFTLFQKFQKDDEAEYPAFGKLVFDKSIPVDSEPDAPSETRIEVGSALANNPGHAVLIVEPLALTEENKDQRIVAWLEATQIGLDAFADYEKLTVLATDLKNGKPLKNVQLAIAGGARSATGADGVAELKLPAAAAAEQKAGLLIARRGADSAILFEDNYYGDDSDWTRKPASDSLRWFVFDDRNIYRTGETVSVKGYLRRIAGGKYADVGSLAAGSVKSLKYVLKDSRGNEILKGTAELNLFGAFDFKLKIPGNINLGEQELNLVADTALDEKEFTHNFQVQEFRRPEFEVTANVETSSPFFVGGDPATIGVEAKYYSGGFLSNAETKWKVTARPVNFAPPNHDDFTFGKFIPWWRDSDDGDYEEPTSEEFKGTTNLNGKHRIAVDFIKTNPACPYTLTAEASVQDVNRQTFTSSTSLLVHPSELYVGLRTAKTFVRAGEKIRIETITTDVDGKPVAGAPVSITAELTDWQKIKGEWREAVIDTQTCATKSQTNSAACEFTAKQGGSYKVKATVLDGRERPNESELDVWVAGGNIEPKREVEQEAAELIPDKKEYAPNETAEILVNAPFYPAEGVLTLRRDGIIKTERFSMASASTVLRIPIEEKYLPNIHAQIDLVGATPMIAYEDARDAKLPKRPAYASGEINLDVSTSSRKLSVTAEPVVKTLEPGGATTINITVKDNQGNPAAGSEVALVAVDESVLALTNYKISDPLDTFYQQIETGTTDYHSREKIILSRPDDIGGGVGFGSGNGNGDGGGGGGGSTLPVYMATEGNRQEKPLIPPSATMDKVTNPGLPPIPIRKNFNALAIFSPSVKTDASGNAAVKINLPDNLTRYRITAIAAAPDAKKFGKAESNITAKQALMVRPSAPRFMNFGDRIELPVVVQNQTDNPLAVNVAVRAANANLTNGSGKKVVVPANDRAEIRFDVAADKTGTARFQIGAVSGKLADAAEFELPVYTPATTEAFATYGMTDQNGAIFQPVEAPKDVFPQFGGLEVTTSSTQLQELTDAFLYLQNYPYECTEQISSRVLSVAALRDVLTAFEAKDLPPKPEIEAKMKSDIERLQKLQHPDGGFSFWRSDDASLPFVSVHVAHALARAALKGYAVPPDITAKSRVYLQNIESKYPAAYSAETRQSISAYALYVRNLYGEKDAAKAGQILHDAGGAEKLAPETLGWLLSVLSGDVNSAADVEAINRQLLNRVTETASAANFITAYTDEGKQVLLASDRRADGIILEALLNEESASQTTAQNPKSEIPNPKSNGLIPKIVRGLLANKIKGRWSNTQENVFVLLALDKYFETYEKQTPDFVARVWLGQTFAGQQIFKGRTTDSKTVSVPMSYLQKQTNSQNLILDKQSGDAGNNKDGSNNGGRLYYRIGLTYAPQNLNLPPADNGFTVTRTYEALDDAGDVKQNPDGSWAIRSGARVRVKVQMVAPSRRYHVALVDRLPAGFEIINSALAVSESVPDDAPPIMKPGSYQSDLIWFEHQNLRDERAEAFASLLSAGVWNYSYVARATTPGNFIAPPAKAEEMYTPETFGQSGADFIKVE